MEDHFQISPSEMCMAKNFIWTTLKAIFSIFTFFLHPQIPDFQIVVSQPNIVLYIPYINGKIIYSAFRLCINLNIEKMYPDDWFCGPGSHMALVHIFIVLVLVHIFLSPQQDQDPKIIDSFIKNWVLEHILILMVLIFKSMPKLTFSWSWFWPLSTCSRVYNKNTKNWFWLVFESKTFFSQSWSQSLSLRIFYGLGPKVWVQDHIVIILVLVHMLLSPQQDQDQENIDL